MLLRKKILILTIVFLLILPISYAQVCEVEKIKQVLRKILYLYFTEPGSMLLTVNEAKDILIFYLSISAQNLTADCSVLGINSNKPIFDVMNLGDSLPDKIPSCTDGTRYGECSKFRPAYCYAGALYSKCDICGCPANSVCGKSNKCEPLVQNITCFKDIDCWQNTFTGDYYCTNDYIARNYLNYTCINPGTTSSRCSSTNGTVWLTYCNPTLNQACVNGLTTCKTTINDSAPTVAISVAPTTAVQGQFFNVTVTGTDDVGLTAIWWWAVNITDTELNKAHWYSCNNVKFCSNSWLVSTNAAGSITLGANSRDTAYPIIGQPHQASEGAGIAYATITVKDVQNVTVQNLTGDPDLVVINLGTYTGTTNTNILISATILNNGTGPAQNTCDGLYVETLNARGFCGGPTLMPGQTKSISSAFALPAPGTYKVRGDTDYGRWVNESNENNNVVWSTITVTSPYSAEYSKANTDLTITNIDVQLPKTSSETTQVYVTTKNSGNLVTGQYWVWTKVTNLGTNAVTNVYRLAPLVEPGFTYATHHGDVGITSYGTYKVEAFIDNYQYIPEFDENNNYMAITVTYGNATANQTQPTGICLIRDSYTSVPVFSAPNVGTGYAKTAKPGVNTISGLQSSCSQTDFSNLLQIYCTQNSNPVQEQVMTYDSQGYYQSLSCGAYGCNFKNCTSILSQVCTDSDGGFNIYKAGLTDGRVNGIGEYFYDTCVNSNGGACSDPICAAIAEGYCLNGKVTNLLSQCPSGCQNGACINQTNVTMQPDLIISDIVFGQSSLTTADAYYTQINITLKNIGTATAQSSVLRVDGAGQYWRLTVSSIAPSAGSTLQISNVYLPAGTYAFTATADADNIVLESNENNNLLTKSLTVSSTSTNQTSQTCGNNICGAPYEYPGNCYADCPSVCGDNLCTTNENSATCYNDCRYIKFGEGLSTTIQSVRLPGNTAFTNITKFREVDANGVSTGNEAIAIHKLKTYYEYALQPQFNANVTSDDPWVLRLVTLQYNSNYQQYKAANPSHYFIINFDYTNLSTKNCVQTDGYFDGSKVRVRSKSYINDVDNTCPLCLNGICD